MKDFKETSSNEKSRIQSEEHKGPLAACLISTHPLKSRADRTRTHTHTPIHVYIRAHGSTRLAADEEAEEAPNPTDVFPMVEGKSNPEEVIRPTPRSVVMAAHVKRNEILPLCWPLT